MNGCGPCADKPGDVADPLTRENECIVLRDWGGGRDVPDCVLAADLPLLAASILACSSFAPTVLGVGADRNCADNGFEKFLTGACRGAGVLW